MSIDIFRSRAVAIPAQMETTMPVESQCRQYATECQRLSAAAGTSIQRSTLLMAMTVSWTTLADQMRRYDAMLRDEAN